MATIVRDPVIIEAEDNANRPIRWHEIEANPNKRYDENLKDVPPPYVASIIKVAEGYMKFTRYPRIAWILSTLFLVIGILILIVGLAHLGEDNDTLVTLMIIGGCVTLVGLVFMLVPRTEYVTLDKVNDRFVILKKNLM